MDSPSVSLLAGGHRWRAATGTALLAALLSVGAGSAQAAGCAADPSCPYRDVSVLGSDPPAGHGVFRFPQGIAFSPGGTYVWVADQRSAIVQKFDRAGNWVLQIGWYADQGQLRRFGVIGGLATDRNNHLYVLDSENDRIQVFRSDTGEWLGAWGSAGASPGRFNLGDNTGAGGIAVHHPTASDDPIVYVADQYNHRVQKFTLDQLSDLDSSGPVLPPGARDPDETNYVALPTPDTTWGSFGNCSPHACTDPGDEQLLNYPQGIAVNSHADGLGRNDVYVADDDNHRVVVYTPNGQFLDQTGSFGTGAGQFRFPYDVGIDSGNFLYVADNSNHRVQKFNAPDLAYADEWGSFGSLPGSLEFPRALSALADDPLGGVYVADTANNRVQGFEPDGTVTANWGVAGRGAGYVTRPGGVAVDNAGDVYVADTWDHRIEKLSASGTYLDQWGYISPNSGYAAPDNEDGEFTYPHGVAFDPLSGNLWIADTGNNRVQEFAPSGTWLATFGGTASGAAQGQFNAPAGIAVDQNGDVYVADTSNDRVQKRDASTGLWSTLGIDVALDDPAAVAADTSGDLYVADRDRVLEVRAGTSTEIDPPNGTFDRPAGLSVNGEHLYIADTRHNRVLRLDTDTMSWDNFGDEGAEPGSFVGPTGLATAPDGSALYVADEFNNRIQQFSFLEHVPPAPAFAQPSASPEHSQQPTATVVPRPRLRARAKQRALRRDGVIVRVECSERCEVTASGKVQASGLRRTLPLRGFKRTILKGTQARLRIPLTNRARLAVRRALLRHNRAIAKVRVTVRDGAGNVASLKRTIEIVR